MKVGNWAGRGKGAVKNSLNPSLGKRDKPLDWYHVTIRFN
jgi:hypothetical protein